MRSTLVRVISPIGPNHFRVAPPLSRRVENAARDFAAAAGPAQVVVLRALGERPCRPDELDDLLGPSVACEAVASLQDAGLVFGQDAYTLTSRGRSLWMSIRALFH